jgi:hypothetical protein
VIKCAFEIAKNSFNMSQMRSARVMHKKTGLLNRIRNIRTSVGDILKSTSKATTKTWIRNRITGGRQFGTCIGGCTTWLTIAHARWEREREFVERVILMPKDQDQSWKILNEGKK